MSIIIIVLYVFAFVLFVASAAGVANPPRFNLPAAGLACWVATHIVGFIGK